MLRFGKREDKRMSRKARSMPEPDFIELPTIPDKFKRIYRAKARDGGEKYDVNLRALTCSCPEFISTRSNWPERDLRRVCEHIYDKLYQTKVERDFDSLSRLLIRYGRSIERFYEYNDAEVYALAGFSQGFDTLFRIFARVGDDVVMDTLDIHFRVWEYSEQKKHHDVLDRLARIFIG